MGDGTAPIMQDHHDGHLTGHFSGPKLYKALVRRWWWRHMYTDVLNYANKDLMCHSTGYRSPPLHPIATERPFQVVGVDIMELPMTANM